MTSEETLPASWQVAPLADVAIVIQGQSPPGSSYNAEGKGLPFFQGKAEFTALSPVASKWCSEPNKIAQSGDVLISVRAPVGPTNLADVTCCIGRGLAAIRPVHGIPTKFLLYYLRYSESDLAGKGTGTTFSAISGDDLRDHRVVVPPLAEQARIVGAIETQLTRLDAAVAALERVRANLKRYRASVLKAAVEGRLVPTEAELARKEGRDFESAAVLLYRILAERHRRWEEFQFSRMKAAGRQHKNDEWKSKYKEPAALDTSTLPQLPDGWCWAPLDALASVVGGVTKGQRRKPTEELRQVPYLRVANVQRGYLDLSVIKEIEATEDEIKELRLKSGDVLFNEGGDRDKLGRGWVWNGEIPECIHQNHVFRARMYTQDLLPKFLSWYGNSSAQLFFLQEGKQTTNLASLNSTNLKKLPVPLPPVAEQKRIAAKIELSLSVADATVNTTDAAIARCNRLRQSILKWAFEGKLVDQGPNDEPASVLLERIRTERAAAVPSRKPKKTETLQSEAAK